MRQHPQLPSWAANARFTLRPQHEHYNLPQLHVARMNTRNNHTRECTFAIRQEMALLC